MSGAGAVRGVGCSLSMCRLHPESGCLNKVCVSLSPTYAGITHLLFCLCKLLLNRKCEKSYKIAISYAFTATVFTGVTIFPKLMSSCIAGIAVDAATAAICHSCSHRRAAKLPISFIPFHAFLDIYECILF